jgi:hypothetical protein
LSGATKPGGLAIRKITRSEHAPHPGGEGAYRTKINAFTVNRTVFIGIQMLRFIFNAGIASFRVFQGTAIDRTVSRVFNSDLKWPLTPGFQNV